MGSIPGSGRSPREENGNPLQYSCLENPWTEEPGEPQPIGSERVGHSWSDLAYTHTHTHTHTQNLDPKSVLYQNTAVDWTVSLRSTCGGAETHFLYLDWDSKIKWDHKGAAPDPMGLVLLSLLPLPGEDTGKDDYPPARSRGSPRACLWRHPDPRHPASRTVRCKPLWFKTPCLWYSVLAFQADQYKHNRHFCRVLTLFSRSANAMQIDRRLHFALFWPLPRAAHHFIKSCFQWQHQMGLVWIPFCAPMSLGFVIIIISFHALVVPSLCCCMQAFSTCGKQGLLCVLVREVLFAVASLVEQGL